MDYGNEDVIGTDALRALTKDLCMLPAQAVCCIEKDCGAWSDSTHESFGALAQVCWRVAGDGYLLAWAGNLWGWPAV